MLFRLATLALFCTSADAFAMGARAPAAVMRRTAASPAMALDLPAVSLLLAEIVDADGERVYGAVEAPGWVLPVGGALAILTALLPVLLAPGDDAFRRQQGDEAKVAGKNNAQVFGRGRRD